MVNYDFVLFGVFLALVVIFYIVKRKEIKFQGLMAIYRTKLGTVAAKKITAKYTKFFHYFGYVSIVIGFLGMIAIFYILFRGGLNLLLNPASQPVVAPVLPFITIPGLPTLLFTYWLIGIFVVAVIHEFSHALLCAAYKVKIKSSGFAFFGPLPAAFVEPDEKQLAKKKKTVQLAVLSAGSASNVVTGIIFLIVFAFILSPGIIAIANVNYKISDVVNGSPAEAAGLKEGMFVEKIASLDATPGNITKVFSLLKPGDNLTIQTSQQTFKIKAVQHPQNASRGFIGVSLETDLTAKKGSNASTLATLIWLQRLFLWLFILSLGIGIFNLLPLGPIDGGRMFMLALGYISKDENKVKKVFAAVSIISLMFILINLAPYLVKFFNWLISFG